MASDEEKKIEVTISKEEVDAAKVEIDAEDDDEDGEVARHQLVMMSNPARGDDLTGGSP